MPATPTTPALHDIERAVLGAMIVYPEDAAKAVIEAGAVIFDKPQYEAVFRAVDYLYEHGEPIDQLTVAARLERDGCLEYIGGEIALVGIMNETGSPANIMHHIALLKEKAALRKLALLGSILKTRAETPGTDPEELIGVIETQCAEIREFTGIKWKTLAEEIREWVLSSDGTFLSSDVTKELQLSTRVAMQNCSKILCKMVEDGIIEREGKRRGSFRRINTDCPEIDWRNAPTESIDISFPLGIEEFVKIMPGNLIVIAGESNAGKTAFLLNFIRRNMYRHDVHYFSSEGGKEEHRLRLLEFPPDEATGRPVDWRHHLYECDGDFQDHIRPDAFNIIDFLEVYDDFYRIGGMLQAIHSKLDNGIAVVVIQKNPGALHGLGGARSIEKARLYLSLEPGLCTIRKAKIWRNKALNPNGLSLGFSIVNGCTIIPDSGGWGKEW